MAKLVWLLVDGLPYDLVDRFAGQLPTLGRAIREGRARRLRPAFPNCQTPPSLASLFSGRQPADTGLTGYFLPRLHLGDPLGIDDAFALAPAGRPRYLWQVAAEAGATIHLLHVPFVDVDKLGAGLQLYSYGFVPAELPPAIRPLIVGRPLDLNVGEAPAWQALWRGGDDVLLRCADGRERILKGPMQVERLRLTDGLDTEIFYQTDVDGTRALVLLGAWRPRVVGDERQTQEYLRHMNDTPFFGATLSRAYRTGALGETLHDGGDGAAERLFVFCLERLAKRYADDCLFATREAQGARSSLVLAYQPVIDLAVHELLGFISGGCVYATDAARAVVEPLLYRLLASIDALLVELLCIAGLDTNVLVSADHGMVPVDTLLYPNVLLREYGWLVLGDAGSIDPEQSVCFYHPAENGLLVFNRVAMQREGVTVDQIAERLLAGVARACGRPAELFDCAIGDLDERWIARHYLRAPAYVQAKSEANGAAVLARSRKTGDHCVHSDAPALEGFVAELRGRFLLPSSSLQTWELGRCAQGLFAKERTSALVE
ncbi:alkaline phosphatase family protein [Paraburkholderia acidisoli]|uniref:Type I phosphodiesterase/nucleotide pyrophosphatase n=1 Tax=Paraburkholderia acidisoli TaxID=2571748 RepID=A0A7Z2GMM1_9BURK|nr:alkaline phosphatase family protein [Paraburkholderia acidisoli]QGZ64591.1 hypothetical protein FAZ98_22375 [Paraburkholderia acidisoli]